MAKKQKKSKPAINKKKSDKSGPGFTEKYPNFIPLAGLFLLLVIFFNELIFENKTFQPPDTLASQSIQPFVKTAFEDGTYPQWNPYIFCGMPSFASLQSAPYVDLFGDILKGAVWLVSRVFPLPDFMIVFLNYFLFGAFIYLLIMRKTGMRLIALFAAVALIFQPPIIAFTVFGHTTKIMTAVFIPLLFFLLDELLEKRQVKYFALFALTVGLQLLRAHTQIAYYTLLMIGLYLVYWIIAAGIRKEAGIQILKSTGAVASALAVGVVMSSWLYLPVMEYADYSIRGGGTGLDFGYATGWSFAPKEMLTFLVPSFFGFGGQTYWGEMPFTDFPLYMGVVTLLLAGLAFVIKPDRYAIFFGIVALLALVISFGRHLPILYNPLYNFFPFFNKFRIPSMILILVQFSVVMLAALGLQKLTEITDKAARLRVKRYLLIAGGLCAVLGLFLLVGKGTYLSWMAASPKGTQSAVQELVYKSIVADSVKLLFIAGGTLVLIYLFLQDKLRKTTLLLGILTVTVIDLWTVSFKIVEPKPKANKEAFFTATSAVNHIKTDSGIYRIFPLVDDKPPNWYAYHKLQNVIGYHAAKLKNYQSFLEASGLTSKNRFGIPSFLSKYVTVQTKDGQPALAAIPPEQISQERINADNAILDMLNVKYLISYYPFRDERYRPVVTSQPYVFENTGAPARAFFVNKIKVMENDEDFYKYLQSGRFDPSQEAVLAQQPEFDIEFSDSNRVEITSYDIHEIKLKAKVAKPSLMVLSEIYYPAGWRAFVNDTETQIYRTNTILRSILLKPGEHEIRFEYHSQTFTLGIWLTMGILAVLCGMVGYSFIPQRKKEAQP